MGRWPKRLPYVVLICALAFGVMPGASFGQDGAVGDLDTKANAGHRFASERLFSAPGQRGDDWEPSVAADGSGHVYIATTRFDGPNACRKCPDPAIVYERSSDGGRTWSGPRFLCPCHGVEEQADPVLVTDERGRLFATWMNDFVVQFSRSDDFGRTWTQPRSVDGRLRWSDKPWIGVSGGKDVYIAFNGPGRTEGTPQTSYDGGPAQVYLRRSADDGATWSPARKISSANEGGVDSEFPMIAAAGPGDVRVAWMDNRSWLWNTWYRRSTDGGRTWSGTARLSDRPDGAPYKSRGGFGFPYGDYGQLAVDGRGRTHAAWGKGPSYAGPGGTWYTRGPLP